MPLSKRGTWSHGSQRLRLVALAVAIGLLATAIEITDTVGGGRWFWASVFAFAAVFAAVFAAYPSRRTWAISGAATVSASVARAAASFLSWDDRGRTTAQASTAGLTWVIVALLAFSAWETYTSVWEVIKDLAVSEEKAPTPAASVAATAATAIAAGATTDAAVIAEQAATDAAKRAREDQ